MDQVKIGNYIAEKRKDLGMTQMQLAEKLTKAFSERYRAKEELNKTAPMRDDMAR